MSQRTHAAALAVVDELIGMGSCEVGEPEPGISAPVTRQLTVRV
jgi:hypothetical protein